MKFFIPSFLKRFDEYLLLNHPLFWISKLHIVLFFGMFMLLFSALVGLVIPLNLSNTQDLGLWYFLFSILSVIALCFWIYRNVIFNIEKKYGLRQWTDEYKIFFLNFACVLMFLSFPLPFTAIYNQRVANFVTDEELIDDINQLNLAAPYIVNDLNAYDSYYDSTTKAYFYDVRKLSRYDDLTPWHIRYDTLKFPQLLSSFQLEVKYGKTLKPDQEILNRLNKYIFVSGKYGFPFNSSSEFELKHYKELYNESPFSVTTFTYRNIGYRYELTRCLENIADAKFNKLFIFRTEFLHFLLYTVFYITLLVMLFKMVNWRQYLITAVALALIPILLFIISQLLPYSVNYRVRENAYVIQLVLVFFTALIFTFLSIRDNHHFNGFKNICAQMVYLSAPVFPMLFVYFLKEIFDVFGVPAGDVYSGIYGNKSLAEQVANDASSYYYSADYLYTQLLQEYWHEQYEIWFYGMMYGGIVCFILILLPLMKQLFVKHLALPRLS